MINIDFYNNNIRNIIELLYKKKIIAYPTESVFGLGCDPDSKKAVYSLLKLKKRSWEKGLILVAANYNQLSNYLNEDIINYKIKSRISSIYPNPITWIVPAKSTTPKWITGRFSSIAIRISTFKSIKNLCLSFGKAIISTSANVSGELPARTIDEVKKKFGNSFPILIGSVGNNSKPSEIRDAINNNLIRKG